MAFEWQKMYKWEENVERDITESVEEYICEYYEISGIEEMTPKQYQEVEAFAEEYNFSVMRIGFSNVLNDWLNYREEEGLDLE